ncbi:hypothetical protein ON05_002180 [Acaryochloris sp. CCMEE 5410]|nr:hypothetical protein ON05_002180 [Acaryochloris sp. CCMEE 5410]
MTKVLVVAMFTLASLGIPLMDNAIAAPQTTLAAVQTQDRMESKQNRALDSQNNPDGIEFGFEEEARLLSLKDTQDNAKGSYGGGASNQRSSGATNKRSTQLDEEESKNMSAAAVNNVQRTVGDTRNLSDRSTIKAKQQAKEELSRK